MGSDNGHDDEWYIECSDEEKYNPSKKDKGLWEPGPKDIVDLYDRLSKGEDLELQWQVPNRRSPSPERTEKDDTMEEEMMEEAPKEEKAEPTEFDFDDDFSEPAAAITPRRTPGSAKASSAKQPRVAQMENILKDIIRHKKMDREKSPRRDGTPHRPVQKMKIRKDPLIARPSDT